MVEILVLTNFLNRSIINTNRINLKALMGKSTMDKLFQRAAGWCEAALPQRKITLEFSAEAF